MRHIALASGRDDKEDELMLQKGVLDIGVGQNTMIAISAWTRGSHQIYSVKLVDLDPETQPRAQSAQLLGHVLSVASLGAI